MGFGSNCSEAICSVVGFCVPGLGSSSGGGVDSVSGLGVAGVGIRNRCISRKGFVNCQELMTYVAHISM